MDYKASRFEKVIIEIAKISILFLILEIIRFGLLNNLKGLTPKGDMLSKVINGFFAINMCAALFIHTVHRLNREKLKISITGREIIASLIILIILELFFVG